MDVTDLKRNAKADGKTMKPEIDFDSDDLAVDFGDDESNGREVATARKVIPCQLD